MLISTPCIIFAGGKSSRMGEDKALLPFSSFKTLTEFQYNRLQKIFKNVYISCKSHKKFDFDANFIEDVQSEDMYAPTVGFIAAFTKLKTEKIFVLSVDTPFVDEKSIKKIFASDHDTCDATIAQTDSGIQPMCGIYHRSLEKSFLNMYTDNRHKLGFLLKNSNTEYVVFDNMELFLNLNYPYEYQKALTLI